jgi:hypothetical protein
MQSGRGLSCDETPNCCDELHQNAKAITHYSWAFQAIFAWKGAWILRAWYRKNGCFFGFHKQMSGNAFRLRLLVVKYITH